MKLGAIQQMIPAQQACQLCGSILAKCDLPSVPWWSMSVIDRMCASCYCIREAYHSVFSERLPQTLLLVMQGVALLPLLGVALLAPRAAHAAWQHASPVPEAISVGCDIVDKCTQKTATCRACLRDAGLRELLHALRLASTPEATGMSIMFRLFWAGRYGEQ